MTHWGRRPQTRILDPAAGSCCVLIAIHVGPYRFGARFEDAAPRTVAKFSSLMPYQQKIIHVRWSGEACWIPLGELDLGLSHENATTYPAPGQVLLYPGGLSETEILLAYGSVNFASKLGAACRQPFHDDHRRSGTARSPRQDGALAGRAGHPLYTGGMMRACDPRATGTADGNAAIGRVPRGGRCREERPILRRLGASGPPRARS